MTLHRPAHLSRPGMTASQRADWCSQQLLYYSPTSSPHHNGSRFEGVRRSRKALVLFGIAYPNRDCLMELDSTRIGATHVGRSQLALPHPAHYVRAVIAVRPIPLQEPLSSRLVNNHKANLCATKPRGEGRRGNSRRGGGIWPGLAVRLRCVRDSSPSLLRLL